MTAAYVERTLLSAAFAVEVGAGGPKPVGIRNRNENKSSGQECPLHIAANFRF